MVIFGVWMTAWVVIFKILPKIWQNFMKFSEISEKFQNGHFSTGSGILVIFGAKNGVSEKRGNHRTIGDFYPGYVSSF